MATAGCHKCTDNKRLRLSGFGLLSVASKLSDSEGPGWSNLAHRLGLPDSFVTEVRRTARDVRRSEEVEFLQRLNDHYLVDEMVKGLETAGFSDLAEIIRQTPQNESSDERVSCISFEVVNPKNEFGVNALGSATLRDCLIPFCADTQIAIEKIQFLNPLHTMSTLVSEVNLKEVVQLELTEPTSTSKANKTKRKNSRTPRIYTTLMIQIGNNTRMFVDDTIQSTNSSDVNTTEDDSDSVSRTYSYASEISTTSSVPSTPPLTPTSPNTPISHHPTIWPQCETPPTPTSTQPTTLESPPPTPPRIPARRSRTVTQRSNSSLQQLYMSDVPDREQQLVEYENHHSLRTHQIPGRIMAAARETDGFWDLPTEHHMNAAHQKLVERFGKKDGRYIVWSYGRLRLVATVTYEGGLRHFQIAWEDGQLTVYRNGVSASDLKSLMDKLKTVPLPLQCGSHVMLRSPIKRIPAEDEEPVTPYMDMSGLDMSVHL